MTRKTIISLCLFSVLGVFVIYGLLASINDAKKRHSYHRQQVYKDGFNCGGHGIPVQANPHQEGTHLYESWQRGWIAGKLGRFNTYDE